MRDGVYASDGPATKVAVLKVLPIGSSIDVAKSTMEAKGFQCKMEHHKPYVDNGVARPPADFLYCDSGEKTVGVLVSKRWQVVFVDANGLVASIAVGVGLTGL